MVLRRKWVEVIPATTMPMVVLAIVAANRGILPLQIITVLCYAWIDGVCVRFAMAKVVVVSTFHRYIR